MVEEKDGKPSKQINLRRRWIVNEDEREKEMEEQFKQAFEEAIKPENLNPDMKDMEKAKEKLRKRAEKEHEQRNRNHWDNLAAILDQSHALSNAGAYLAEIP